MASAANSSVASTVWGSTVPGAHSDYTIIQNFEYGNGAEPTVTTGPGQDLKKWIVDSPAGLSGNPNAIPESLRCDPADFDETPAPLAAFNAFYPGACPDSAQVGTATVYLVNDADTPSPGCTPTIDPFACIPGGANMTPMTGKIYLLKTTPEVPTTLGTIFTTGAYQSYDLSGIAGPGAPACTVTLPTPCILHPKTKSVLAPVTSGDDGDFRIRTIPAEYTNPPNAILPNTSGYTHAAFTPPGSLGTPLHIRRIDQKLFGMVDPNVTPGDTTDDVPFLTNPTRCSAWDSYSYAHVWAGNSGSLNMDPDHPSDVFTKSAADSVTPDCSSLPPFNASLTASLNTKERSSNPQLDVVMTNTGVPGGDVPKNAVVTLPGSLAADIDAIATDRLCTIDQRNSSTCPATSKVGTVKIDTPMISAGLTGEVFLIRKDEGGLPNLSMFITGAIDFRLDATTRYVGARGTEIETTLTNLPQVPFTKFSLTIAGGASNSLLVFRECATDGSAPEDGPIRSVLTGYTDAVKSESSATDANGCYGTPRISKIRKCVRYKLAVTPRNMLNSANIAKVELYIGKTKRSQRTRLTKDIAAPWKLQKRLGTKFKKGKKFYYYVKTTYKPTVDAPKGKVMKSKIGSFKRCK